ncbi:MAG TPA: hypothetical protein VJI12_02245 [archaeon]|nr:hypothetical protein [archaeon]
MGGSTGTGWAGVSYRTLRDIAAKTEGRWPPVVAFIGNSPHEFAVVGEPGYITDLMKKAFARGISGSMTNIYE